MPDLIDHAQDRADELTADALAAVRRAARAGPVAVGACLYCGEELPPGRLFCDAECRDDYDREQQLKKLNGRTA